MPSSFIQRDVINMMTILKHAAACLESLQFAHHCMPSVRGSPVHALFTEINEISQSCLA